MKNQPETIKPTPRRNMHTRQRTFATSENVEGINQQSETDKREHKDLNVLKPARLLRKRFERTEHDGSDHLL